MKPTIENTFVLIPARKGSKGVPNKNSKPFSKGASLTERTIQTALSTLPKSSVFLSTNDDSLFSLEEKYNINLIRRTESLSDDHSSMMDVILDGLIHKQDNHFFLLLLQPTSPFRKTEHIQQAMNLFETGDQAVVSVNEPAGNPFYTLFEKLDTGFINKWATNSITRRQDLNTYYDVNGLLYLFEIESLFKKPWVEFESIRPLIISKWEAIDIDNQEDWEFAERIDSSNE
jgi:CMP-N,N'-diacetyllegionaminic acid synthase